MESLCDISSLSSLLSPLSLSPVPTALPPTPIHAHLWCYPIEDVLTADPAGPGLPGNPNAPADPFKGKDNEMVKHTTLHHHHPTVGLGGHSQVFPLVQFGQVVLWLPCCPAIDEAHT